MPIRASELATLFQDFAHRRGVVLAVSGGVDSMALMHLAALWRDAGGSTPLTVATIDHGLRPGSDKDCKMVQRAAKALGFRSRTLAWAGKKPKTRLQEQARQARYRLLTDYALACGFDAIATAHTLDDQRETVIMRLARGSGVDGLMAMQPVVQRGALVHLRPLLSVEKARLVETLVAANMAWAEDPSNDNSAFERVRVRRLAAVLDQSGLSAHRMGVLSKRVARAVEALDKTAAALLAQIAEDKGAYLQLDAVQFFAAPAEIRLRVLAAALWRGAGRDASGPEPLGPRLERLEALHEGLETAWKGGKSTRRTLAGALIALYSHGVLTVKREKNRRIRG